MLLLLTGFQMGLGSLGGCRIAEKAGKQISLVLPGTPALLTHGFELQEAHFRLQVQPVWGSVEMP